MRLLLRRTKSLKRAIVKRLNGRDVAVDAPAKTCELVLRIRLTLLTSVVVYFSHLVLLAVEIISS